MIGRPGWEIKLLEIKKRRKTKNSIVLRRTRQNPKHHSLQGLVLLLLHMYMDGSVSHVDVVMYILMSL